jgi:hypothetical protein
MKRTPNGSYKFGRFEVFLNVHFWRWGSFNIGNTHVLQRGPVRVFIYHYHRNPMVWSQKWRYWAHRFGWLWSPSCNIVGTPFGRKGKDQ